MKGRAGTSHEEAPQAHCLQVGFEADDAVNGYDLGDGAGLVVVA